MLWERSLTLERMASTEIALCEAGDAWRNGVPVRIAEAFLKGWIPPHPAHLRKDLREGRQIQNSFWLRGGLRVPGEIDTFGRPDACLRQRFSSAWSWRDEQPVAHPSPESTPNGLQGLGKMVSPEISHLCKTLRILRSFGEIRNFVFPDWPTQRFESRPALEPFSGKTGNSPVSRMKVACPSLSGRALESSKPSDDLRSVFRNSETRRSRYSVRPTSTLIATAINGFPSSPGV